MHKVRILFFSSLCLLVSGLASPLYGEEKIITIGGKEGWPELSVEKNIVRGEGRFGYECMELSTNSRKVNDNTDLLINFEDSSVRDVSSHYNVLEDSILYSDNSIMGKKSGLCRGTGGLRLRGNEDSLFGTSGVTGSFLIEFWLCPSIAENGEVVFSWRSSRTVDNYPLYQLITAGFFNNHLQWRFINVFSGLTENNGEVMLESYSTIIPNRWTHHAISYNQETGLLEYRINGKLEELRYVTTNGRENGGSVYPARLGVAADIDICPQYTGCIDDFRIQRDDINESAADLRYDEYSTAGGRFETQPVMVSKGASLTEIDSIVTEPEQTAIVIYVRSGDNFFNWTDSYPEWKSVNPGESITDVSGLYFQVAVDLFTDGSGKITPSVTELDLHFSEVPSPLPPFTISAEAGDGQVTLTWSYSVDNTAGGYFVYYGERPGEYLGRIAVEGPSPINVGNVSRITLTGLENGKIYYFAVSSYSSLDNRIMGVLSKEVFARPLHR